MHYLLILISVSLLGCSHPAAPSKTEPVSDNDMSTQISEAEAKELAQQFVDKEWNQRAEAREYALEFESIRLHEGVYQVRFTKKFHEPTKENPPYRLVLVRLDRTVNWGMP
jgi:hypothetical protein